MVKSEKFYKRCRNAKFIGAICTIVIGTGMVITSLCMLPDYIKNLKTQKNNEAITKNGTYSEYVFSDERHELINEQEKLEKWGLSLSCGGIGALGIATALLYSSNKDDDRADEERRKREKAERVKNAKIKELPEESVVVEAD